MADKSVLTISIVTPDGERYNRQDVKMIVLDTKSGQLGIMPDHAPIIASLEVNEVKVEYDGKTDKVAVNGGFVEFSHNVATIVANSAEKQSDINVPRAQRAQKRAQANIKKAKAAHDKETLDAEELALRRAINRIYVAKH
ncbi:F0F1 ATP synthase subunit epsilon [Acetilactobacillus jinshanensis]|uniref:ATP synthase epsilon chain n=1 Tax=Acetilactobacillus jinshanensis TaxID=1720083 RepID=A0A4P6ZMV9_9LACO|nr:F0F1 ATP synthase subunit epsilon [Acetilactobacillus jinshanensis]QBP18772.1 F0F1 ATP synthase subunit epsilon [Acetilactobacillus jinshanensis]URL61643.1 F0F1 ATP synthase subunit epsilon [uncultured bacterium]